jgi:hypothetical protein
MSRFGFYEDVDAQRLATYAVDRLLIELERYHKERLHGRLTFQIDIDAGNPSKVIVTPMASVMPANLTNGDESR